MSVLTKEDLVEIKRKIELFKNDEKAQRRVTQKMAKVARHLEVIKRKRIIPPEVWQHRMTM